MSLPYSDPANPANPSPLFNDITAVRGDHMRANNNAIFADLTYLENEIAANWARTIFGDNAYGSTLVTDLNAITKSGFYTCYGAATGVPNADSSWFVMHQNSAVGTVSEYQRAVAFSTKLIVYERAKISSTWGAWTLANGIVSDTYTKSVPTSTASLTDAELNYGMVIFSGATVDVTVTWSTSYTKKCRFKNADSTYKITVKTSAGTGVTLYPGDVWDLYCDGTDVLPLWWNENVQLGVERLSSERREGYPVYWKLIDTGAMPNTATINTPHGITGTFTVISREGIAWNASGVSRPFTTITYGGNSFAVSLLSDATNITVTTAGNLSTYTKSRVLLKYVKAAL